MLSQVWRFRHTRHGSIVTIAVLHILRFHLQRESEVITSYLKESLHKHQFQLQLWSHPCTLDSDIAPILLSSDGELLAWSEWPYICTVPICCVSSSKCWARKDFQPGHWRWWGPETSRQTEVWLWSRMFLCSSAGIWSNVTLSVYWSFIGSSDMKSEFLYWLALFIIQHFCERGQDLVCDCLSYKRMWCRDFNSGRNLAGWLQHRCDNWNMHLLILWEQPRLR